MAAVASHRVLIKLSGSLAQKFGRLHPKLLDTGKASEAFKALKATLPGFEEEVKRLDKLGMRFAIFRNGKNVGEGDLGRSGSQEIRIVPVVEGGKRAGVLQTIIGVILIAVSFIPGFQAAAGPGIALVAGGVIQMLSPQASGLSQSAAPENLPSYAFGSAKNTTASGNPVPICIGERRWGGAIISASIEAQDKA